MTLMGGALGINATPLARTDPSLGFTLIQPEIICNWSSMLKYVVECMFCLSSQMSATVLTSVRKHLSSYGNLLCCAVIFATPVGDGTSPEGVK